MKTRFFKPAKITWVIFAIFVTVALLGASQRVAFLDDANDRETNLLFQFLPGFVQSFPLYDLWLYTMVPIVVAFGGNVWVYGLNPQSGQLAKEITFISVTMVYYYVISCSAAFVICNKKRDGWKNYKRNNRILLIASVAYPALLISAGMYGFYYIQHDVGYAPSPQESFFFKLTILGSMSSMILFVLIGTLYWAGNQKPKKPLTAVPFVLLFVILFLLLSGVLPKGANA